MSAIADLFNVPFTDEERATWAFAHMAHHRDINRVIYQLTKLALPEYPLDQINPDDTGVWEYQHQLMHDNQNSVLGITGQDLSEVNWRDPQLLEGWVFLNRIEHFQAANILKIG